MEEEPTPIPESNISAQPKETQPPADAVAVSSTKLSSYQTARKFGPLAVIWIFLVVIFLYGMTIPQTEAGVNQVGTAFFYGGAVAAIISSVLFAQKTLESLRSPIAPIKKQHKSSNVIIGIVLFLLLGVFLWPVAILAGLIWLVKAINRSVQGRGKSMSKIAQGFILAVSVITGFVTVGAAVLVGSFFLALRACELSSSKCL